jgi:peptide/nickel transport system permease protein
MFSYILKRLVMVVPTLIGVMLIVFFLTYTIGNPAVLLVPPEAEPEDIRRVEAVLGLDQPIHVQFIRYLGRIVRLDFGGSFYSDRPALGLVIERLPATARLTLAALGLAVLIGVPAGLLGAMWRGKIADMMLSASVLFGMSIPNFWFGLVLIIVFGVQLRVLPISGDGTIRHLVLPAVTLATGMLAITARLIRNDLLEVLNADYIRTARAKGVSNVVVFLRHALKNSVTPVITLIGLQLGALLGGAIVTESVFAWPGVGRLILQSIERRDYPVVQAATFVLALIFILTNLIVDLVCARLDPRIVYE